MVSGRYHSTSLLRKKKSIVMLVKPIQFFEFIKNPDPDPIPSTIRMNYFKQLQTQDYSFCQSQNLKLRLTILYIKWLAYYKSARGNKCSIYSMCKFYLKKKLDVDEN